ncbi:HD domain-containing protein [Clostridium sp. JN-9]|uniref:HD domain-containing protein n=1 Tax=Clostridium sp. JN-9 TaxID=2507159 RepID=UPI000FFE0AE2|nr:HD domain-containing protein [Clostridium sp. JN-9]QAT39696.1 HD domain-containing protein [Clostridium sp. JN-9]
MEETILKEGRNFLVSYLKNKNIDYETIHPWRNNWEFIILHSFRVEGYVKKILDGEMQSLSSEEILTLRLAALLHDIGKVDNKEDHAVTGRNIINNWLNNNQEILHGIKEPNRLLYLIENHSNKEDDESDYCLQVLKDADILDEIGIMSVFMASSWIDRSNPYFFNLLSDRINNFEISFCDKKIKLLKTETAKSILKAKKNFIVSLDKQLKDELYGTEMFGEASIEDYFKNAEQ